MKPNPRKARKTLGLTEVVTVKLHPDLMQYVEEQAKLAYCSRAEFIRRLITKDKERHGAK